MYEGRTPLPQPPSASVPTDLRDQAAAVYRDVLLPTRYATFAARAPDSPPEADLTFALVTVLDKPLRSGALELHQRVIVRHPTFSADHYEIDIVLRQPSTAAEAWIDPSSWRYKDRSEAEYEYARRRQRELTRICPNYLPYSTSEVTRDVWGCCLDIIERIGTTWTDFAPISLPAGLGSYLTRLSTRASKSLVDIDPVTDAAATLTPAQSALLWDLRRAIASLPRQAMTGDPEIAAARRTHPRSHERYTPRENELLTRAARERLPVPLIASAMQRSPRGVALQLERLGVAAA
ncbi:MAG: hypothetical protein M3P51_15900 [Chloroflexota bacterium]|nr:hypothetical protein [Chloroflexota bacterium]